MEAEEEALVVAGETGMLRRESSSRPSSERPLSPGSDSQGEVDKDVDVVDNVRLERRKRQRSPRGGGA